MGLQVSCGTGADSARIAQMLIDFNKEFDTPTPSFAEVEAFVSQRSDDPNLMVLLAGNDPLIGLAVVSLRPSVWLSGPVAMLDELYVVPDQRNCGVGSELLHAVFREVRIRGVEEIQIPVDGDDVDAQRFYERHGFLEREPGELTPARFYFRELASK